MGTAQFGKAFTEWFGSSFFGESARLEPQKGYVAPPLDGIWATAPYLHNGSVPTLAALLDSNTRPTYWTRDWDDSKLSSYDQVAVGWKARPFAHGKDDEPSEESKKNIYDTTKPGYTNKGHLFGDVLADDERSAVLEYLKTL
jgi:hypothetical protein